MSEESISYQDGDIVWVKLLYCWWPGEVLSLDKVPAEVKESFKQPPLAVVRFFQEDTFEYVKAGQEKNICLYTSEKKNDYIKRGMDLVRSKAKAALMTKFPADVCTAERLTGGNPNILNEPQFAELLITSSSVSAAVKRRNSSSGSNSGVGGVTPSGRSRGRGRARGTGRGRGAARMSTGSIIDNKFYSTPSPKKVKLNKEIIVTHPRFINDDIDDHEIVELIQTKRPSMEPIMPENFFTCSICEFKTLRVDVLVMHREVHSQKPIKRKTTSPKKPRKTYPMPKSKTKTLEEDIALVRSGKTVEDFLSDDEIPPKRVKKSKTTPKAPKEKKESKLDTSKTAKKEEVKKIDREELVAEWNEIEESEDETQENCDIKIEETKSNMNDAIKSCFDFDEEDSEEILTTVEGRKIPRVIPEPERTQSPKIELESKSNNSDVVEHVKEIPKDEETVVLKKLEDVPKKTSIIEETDLGLDSFKSILESTNVPQLPDIPQIREKCEQNFHDTRTIKFPDKNYPAPPQIDKQESNGFVDKGASDVVPMSVSSDVSGAIVLPIKTESATKLTNPKKRFVRSFQEEKAKVQDRLEKLEKERLAREKAPEIGNELFSKEIPERVEIPERAQSVENKTEELPQQDNEIETVKPYVLERKIQHHTSKKSERKSKYKPKRRGLYKKPEIIADIVNSFIDDDLDANGDKNKSKLNDIPIESNNIICNLKSSDETQIYKEPIIDHNASNDIVQSITEAEIASGNEFTNESARPKSTENIQFESIDTIPKQKAIIGAPEVPQDVLPDPNEIPQAPIEVSLTPDEVPLPSEVSLAPIEVSLAPDEVPLTPNEVSLPPNQVPLQISEIPLPPDEFPLKQTKEVPLKEAKEVPLKQAKEVPLKQAKEVPLKQAKEVPPKQTKEVPLKQTKEVPPKQTKEVPLKQTKEVPPKETKEVALQIYEVPLQIYEVPLDISEIPLPPNEAPLPAIKVPVQPERVPQEVEEVQQVLERKDSQAAEKEKQDLEYPTEDCIEKTELRQEQKAGESKSISESNETDDSELVINISDDKCRDIALETAPSVSDVTINSISMELDEEECVSESHTKIVDMYESNALPESPEKGDGKSEDYGTSLPESPASEEVSSLSNPEETETIKEEIEEFELPSKVIPEVIEQPENHIIDSNVISANEIHEASILINTGTHNSEELSALNTLATLSEMIQPEFDVRVLRKEEHLLSTFESSKEISNILDIEESVIQPEILEKEPEALHEKIEDIIETTSEINEPIFEVNEVITEKVPDLNDTVPEVLDKITVFPDEQLVKGQMEIVTLNSSEPMSNDSSKTDMELETINENVSVITETKALDLKSFVVREPTSVSDYKELSTENESVLEKPKPESICAIEEEEDEKPLQSADKDEANTIQEEVILSPVKDDCGSLITNEDYHFPTTIRNTIVPEEIPQLQEIPASVSSIRTKQQAIESAYISNRKLESVIVSQSDTLAAAIANTIESEMAKLTDTTMDVATLPIQQKETSSSKLLEILSESKSISETKLRKDHLQGHKKQVILSKTAGTKPPTKAIILSDQVIKPARNETDSVVVQKVSNKRTLEDFEDIDAYIIQKPGKKPMVKAELEVTPSPPVPKVLKKSSPRSRPRILQQTIITAAGDVIQPDGQQVDDQAMFDINSMPIVLSDQILTPESLEIMPMILQDSPQTSKVMPTIKTTTQTVKLLNKTPTESVIKSSPKALLRGYHKAPQRSIPGQKKSITVPVTQVKTNYILVPSTTSSTSATTVTGTASKKHTIKRQGSQLLLQTTKLTTPTAEPTGNKIMIVTNNLGQQQRVVLTPAQQKIFMQQNSNKLKVTTTVATTVASKMVKVNARPNILSHSKTQLISTSTSSGQTILLAPSQMITPLTPQQMKTATKVAPTKLKLTKYIHSGPGTANPQQGNIPNSKTIIIKNQQGHTVKKIQGTPDADLDRQVAEQIEAIKAAEAIKNAVKATQSPLSKDGKVSKQIPVKKLVAAVKPQQQQQPMQLQRKSVVRKTFSESARSLALAGTTKVPGSNTNVPPLAPLLQQSHFNTPNQETIQPAAASPEKIVPSSLPASNQLNPSLDKDGEKRQLVMQDDQGNMSAIPVGQILAIPNETIDGQAQSYMLVTMDETGNLIPINQETLMSIDPNILGNMVVQNTEQVPPKAEPEAPKPVEKESLPAVLPQEELPETCVVGSPPTMEAPQVSSPPPECTAPDPITPDIDSPNTLLPAEVPTNLHSTTCNINNGDVNKQVVITGDPVVTQKFLESLAGNQELFNLLANAEGNLLIHADGQQILINTSNTPVDNTMLDHPESNVEDRNPVMSNPSTKNHDILAAALADTDVIPSKLPPSQLSPGTSLYPLHSSTVLETSAMNSPIMTPLEVTETHRKKIDDILGQVPKGVSDLPITITDPNISHTVAQQQLSNDLHASLELPLSIPDHNVATSVGMNSPSFPSYSLPNLDEEISQKSFGQSISMPLLTDDSEEAITTTEERTGTTDSLADTGMKLDTASSSSIISTKEDYSLVDRMCSMRTSRICSSLSEPPPDMFDYTPEPTDVSEHQLHDTKGERDSLLQKVTAAMKKAFESDLPSTHIDNDMLTATVVRVEDTFTDVTVKDEDKSVEYLPLSESEKISDLPTDTAEVERVKTKEELFEPNLTPQFHSPSTNTDDSCEIPVQPPIVTALDEKSDDADMNDTNPCADHDECDNDNKLLSKLI